MFATYAKLRMDVARKLGFNSEDVRFEGGRVHAGNRDAALGEAAQDWPLSADDQIEYNDLGKKYQQSTFAPHYVEVGVDRFTGETWIRLMLTVTPNRVPHQRPSHLVSG